MTYKTGNTNNRPFPFRGPRPRRPTSEVVINSNNDTLYKDVRELIRLCRFHMPEKFIDTGSCVYEICNQIEKHMKEIE